MVTVRVYTDASIKGGRGAWATVIIREGADPVEHCGPLRGRFHSSTATEICAVANAVHKARRGGLIEPGDHVIIWCDNEAAVLRINGHAPTKRTTDPLLVKAAAAIAAAAASAPFTFRARHVKGHQAMATVCANGTYNLRCDELCSAIRDGKTAPPFASLLGRIAKERANLAKREAKAISQEEAIAAMRARAAA